MPIAPEGSILPTWKAGGRTTPPPTRGGGFIDEWPRFCYSRTGGYCVASGEVIANMGTPLDFFEISIAIHVRRHGSACTRSLSNQGRSKWQGDFHEIIPSILGKVSAPIVARPH
jgi:hypothetical protein